MKLLSTLLILAVCSLAHGDDFAAFGVSTDTLTTKKTNFEELVARKMTEQLSQFVAKENFQVYIEVKLNNKKARVIESSSHIQLGMLGTVANLQPARTQTAGSKFIDRIDELKITLFTTEDIESDTQNRMLEIAKNQISFLKSDIIKTELKPLARPPFFSMALLKDYQVLWGALFVSFVFLFGFHYLAQKLPQQISEAYIAAALPMAQSQNVQLLPAPEVMGGFRHQVMQEDHFFKLPLAVQQTVIAFASFTTVQEVYTLLSPKYKKLFWSCLPKDLQVLPEGQLIKQGCTIQDVENSEGWAILSKDVHTYVQRNQEVIASLHPEIRFYFQTAGRGNEQAS